MARARHSMDDCVEEEPKVGFFKRLFSKKARKDARARAGPSKGRKLGEEEKGWRTWGWVSGGGGRGGRGRRVSGKRNFGEACMDALRWGPNLPRMLLLFFNLLVLLCGLASIGLGGVFLVSSMFTDPLVGKDSDASPVFLVLMGIMLISLAFFCTYGMFFQNFHVIIMFMGLLLVMIALQLAMATVAQVRWPNSTISIKAHMASAYNAVVMQPLVTPVTRDFHAFQKVHKCCGLNGPTDYEKTYNGTYPSSCCNRATCGVQTAHKRGCVKVAMELFKDTINTYTYFLIFVSFLCLLDGLIALFVAKYIWNYRPEQGFRISFKL